MLLALFIRDDDGDAFYTHPAGGAAVQEHSSIDRDSRPNKLTWRDVWQGRGLGLNKYVELHVKNFMY